MDTQQMRLARWSMTSFSSMTYPSRVRAACRFNPNRGATPKSNDINTDLIYKRAFCNYL